MIFQIRDNLWFAQAYTYIYTFVFIYERKFLQLGKMDMYENKNTPNALQSKHTIASWNLTVLQILEISCEKSLATVCCHSDNWLILHSARATICFWDICSGCN